MRILILLLLPVTGFAGLDWETREVDVAAGLHDRLARVSFGFKNTGDAAVTLREVQPNCLCTTVELSKWNYAPGEKGEIQAVFDFGDRTGIQEKIIQVTTDDPQAPPVRLKLRVTIPELLTCTPRVLRWTGKDPAEQSLVVTITDPTKRGSIEVGPPAPAGFTARVEMVEPGKSYRLLIRPQAPTAAPNERVPIPCVARLDDGTTYPFRVYAVRQEATP